jgi:hypothetical protein
MRTLIRRTTALFMLGCMAAIASGDGTPRAAFARTPATSSDLPPQLLPVYGGTGGTAFNHSCGAGYVLTGLRVRGGLLLDAVGLLCRPVQSDGTLGSETTVGALTGGTGGTAAIADCGAGKVVVSIQMYFGLYVDGFAIACRTWTPGTRTFASSPTGETYASGAHWYSGSPTREQCESTKQPAHGLRGRSASVVDAMGLICDEP